MISVKNVFISAGNKEIIFDCSFILMPGSLHVCMGQNGSGKSTLLSAIMGHPNYTVTGGSVTVYGYDFIKMSVCERARLGVFFVQQYPCILSGVSLYIILKEAFFSYNVHASLNDFEQILKESQKILSIDDCMIHRSLHDGMSGGEKKRCELLQMLVLRPRIILLDEIDSGLDIDAVQCVAKIINQYRLNNPDVIIFLVTHYQRILNYCIPDFVHIMSAGIFVKSGGVELVEQIELGGYEQFEKK